MRQRHSKINPAVLGSLNHLALVPAAVSSGRLHRQSVDVTFVYMPSPAGSRMPQQGQRWERGQQPAGGYGSIGGPRRRGAAAAAGTAIVTDEEGWEEVAQDNGSQQRQQRYGGRGGGYGGGGRDRYDRSNNGGGGGYDDDGYGGGRRAGGPQRRSGGIFDRLGPAEEDGYGAPGFSDRRGGRGGRGGPYDMRRGGGRMGMQQQGYRPEDEEG